MRLLGRILVAAVLFLTLQIAGPFTSGSDAPAKPAPAEAAPAEETDPLGANAACYVCHISFVKEELAKVHLAAKVTCVKCHGLSAKHANDEDIGATKPDITYRRSEIDPSCVKCHETHDVAAKKIVACLDERRLPASPSPVCTQCHGAHKIEAKLREGCSP